MPRIPWLSPRQPRPISPTLHPYGLDVTYLPELEELRTHRIAGVGHRLELNPSATSHPLLKQIPQAIADHDPTLHNQLLPTLPMAPPSLRPHIIELLDELLTSTPSHKWDRLFRINDYRIALGLEAIDRSHYG